MNELLHPHNLSITQLHIKTGIRRATLSELANGKRQRVQSEHLSKIAEALDITDTNELLRLVEDGDDNENQL
ncbi:helix-turn-helix domain-containing protein [Oceanobacillus alkalisoli]|uniref:helix-turn-helix domain-containing protein n=1 Tax=Oceanobacillus alkalisoli TaxID=2925113 RepID=UPI0034E2064B